MKKIASVLCFLLLVWGNLAAAATGFYIGGDFGMKAVTTDAKLILGPINTTLLGVPLAASLISNTNMGSIGGSGTLFGGYRIDINKCYFLSFEANAEFNSVTLDGNGSVIVDPLLTLAIFNSQVTVKQSYGLSLLPGYQISKKFLIYARAGLSVGRIDTTITTPFSTISKSFNKTGGQFGVGTEYKIAKHLKLRSEYIYTVYPTVTSSTTTDLIGTLNVPMTARFLVRSSAFNLGLNYSFA